MEFVLLIIAIVIVSVIAGAMKKKPKSSDEQDAPPPRHTMTDIQRAFMMAAGMPDEQSAPPRPAAPYDPQPGPYEPSFAPYDPQSAPYAPMYAPYEPSAAPFTPPAASYVAQPFEGPTQDTRLRTAAQSTNPFAGAQLSSYVMDEEDDDLMPAAMTARQQQIGGDGAGIKLFENQHDIVKGLIYAEILPRRSGAQRHR